MRGTAAFPFQSEEQVTGTECKPVVLSSHPTSVCDIVCASLVSLQIFCLALHHPYPRNFLL